MMFFRAFLVLLLMSSAASASLTPQDKQLLPFQGIVPNGGCENGVIGWTAYADAASSIPVDMTGGAPAVTVASTASNPLLGNAACLITKDAADRQGQGYAQAVTVPIGYRGQTLSVSGVFKVNSGTYASGDLKVFVYDVTNNSVLTAAGASLSGQQGRFTAEFSTASTTASIRVGVHVATTSASAYAVQVDNLQIHFGGDGSGGSADAVTKQITQSAHGFAVGDVLYFDGVDYALAQADVDTTSEVLGIVSSVETANIFTMTTNGYMTGLSGLVAGTTYYLSDTSAGDLTATEPADANEISKPVLVADTTTSGYVIHSRGVIVSSGGGGGAGVSSISKSGDPLLTGDVTLSAGSNITLTQTGQDIQIASSGTGTVYAWSGFNQSDCNFTASSASYVDFSFDSTCTLNEIVNSNFGVVSKYTSGPNFGAGITLSPPVTGIYEVCASVNYILADGVGGSIRLQDVTNAVVVGESAIAGTGVGDENQNVFICGLYNASSTSSRTFEVRGASTGGSTITLGHQVASNRTIEWRLKKIN